jgi:Protein of unknown function (DUF1579)
MYDFPKVGLEQERLSLFTGEWDSQVRFYFDPSVPPMEKIGRYTAKLDLGGYFLHREFEVQLDDAGNFAELAFHGRGLTGYDPFARKYLGVWADSGSPALYRTEGAFDSSGKVFKEASVGPGPSGEDLHLSMTTEVTSQDRLLFKIWRQLETGEDVLVTEMAHVRRR